MPIEPTQREQEFDEARIAMKTGKVVICVFHDGRRSVVSKLFAKREDGHREMFAETTMLGTVRDFARLAIFENIREAQQFLFEKAAAA